MVAGRARVIVIMWRRARADRRKFNHRRRDVLRLRKNRRDIYCTLAIIYTRRYWAGASNVRALPMVGKYARVKQQSDAVLRTLRAYRVITRRSRALGVLYRSGRQLNGAQLLHPERGRRIQ